MSWDWDKLMEQKKSSSGGGFGTPPRMEDVLDKIKGARGKFPVSFKLLIIAAVIILLASSCFYTVDVDEVGVIQRFGRYVRVTQPGLNFKLPRFIEDVSKVKVRYVFKEEFGFRTVEPGVRSRFASGPTYESESLMLTGDLNVAVVPWIVQYRVKDPYNFLFKVRNVRTTLRDLSESAMRLVVGDRSINEVISKREEIASEAAAFLQKELDDAETGIQVVTIEMKRTNVPEPVQPSFNEVNQAGQEKEKLIYQAKEEYNKVIPAAMGEAEKTIRSAEGYSLALINRAKGDASRFVDLYQEYAKAKDITKRRLYLEAIQEIYPKIGTKYLLDADMKNLLPLLNLGKMEGAK
ncbi:MAG: FtsH protease activity modulator HflK [Desulfobacteraceae bacterium]|nr:MAG: FtsH protease activity modulator HflK [Desulfobacteraceae bacterium]